MKTSGVCPVPLDPALAHRLASQLLVWFEANQRPMPWRERRDPYSIWVSEIMLQQTQVATVIPYYERFMERFPTIAALAEAPQDELLKHWEGLGYYSRARNLHKAAQQIARTESGVFPRDFEQIRALPGIGDYTAGAISAIAFNQPRPAVDGNVLRVLSRWFALPDDVTRPQTRKRFEDLAARLIPVGEASRFNQALMEFGATVCTPARPRCASCPLRADCAAWSQGRVGRLPFKSRKAPPKDVTYAVAVIERIDGRLLIVRRPNDGLLGGLWEFPTFEVSRQEEAEAALLQTTHERFGMRLTSLVGLVVVPHAFTHRRAVFMAFKAQPAPGSGLPTEGADLRWVKPDDLERFAFPLAHNTIRKALLPSAQLALEF